MSVVANSIDDVGPSWAGLRVLVVDDNDDVADCLVMMLQRLGYLARACCCGRDCLGCLHEFRPQAILLDLSMPFQDGFETCRQIRQTEGFEDVPVIACSALDWFEVAERAVGYKFTSHLTKPVSYRQLQATIEESVGVPSV